MVDRYRSQLASYRGIAADKRKFCLLMLGKINAWRSNAGAPNLVLGESPVPQIQANSCLETGVCSSWSLEGLKPYMRYSLAGGSQAHIEDWWHEIFWESTYAIDVPGLIDRAVSGFVEDHDGVPNLLSPWFRKVSIGLAWSSEQFVVFLLYEGDYIEYLSDPYISQGLLRFSGHLKNGDKFYELDDLVVDVWYDPPAASPTLNQLVRVRSYDWGVIVASLRRPLPVGYNWTEEFGSVDVLRFSRPEDFPPDVPMPTNINEQIDLMAEARQSNRLAVKSNVSFPYLTCQEWDLRENYFSVSVDMSSITGEWGSGIYTLALWCGMSAAKESVKISSHSIFLDDDTNW